MRAVAASATGTARLVALAFAAGTLALPTTADAAGPAGTLVLSGSGAGYADVVVPRSISFVPMHLTGTLDQNRNRVADGWSWTGCGRIRGFYLRPLAGDPMSGAGAVDFADLRFGAPTDLPWVGGPLPRHPTPLGASHMGVGVKHATPARLPAGRYRAFLVGEGACQVRVTVSGLRGAVHVRTAHRAVLQHAVRDMEPVDTRAAPGPRAMVANVPVTARPNTLGFAFLHRVGIDSANGQFAPSTFNVWEACIERDPSMLCAGNPVTPARRDWEMYANGTWGLPPWFSTPAGPVSPRNGPFPSVTQIGAWYRPGLLAAGPPLMAKVVGVSVPTTTALQAAVVALDL